MMHEHYLEMKRIYDMSHIVFSEVKNAKDVYTVLKARNYKEGYHYLAPNWYVSKSIVNNILKEFQGVTVLNENGEITARNFI